MQQRRDQDLDIVIVECCENCESHQMVSRHSEWKYFEQFNEMKRKIERFVNNVIVIKNPIPDELVKSSEIKNQKNAYLNKVTNQRVIFPRVGAFEIYIYNILIFSKLISNAWPNHYKIVQLLTSIIQDKKKSNPIDQYSVYQIQQPPETKPIKQSKEVKEIKEVKEVKEVKEPSIEKKKKTFIRIYKSKDKEKSINLSKVQDLLDKKKSGIESVSKELKRKKQQKEVVNRYLETKGQKRQKLPPLHNTISFSRDERQQDSLKKIFNSIEQLEQEDISIIQKKENDNNYDSLVFQNNQSSILKNKRSVQNLQDEKLRFVQNKSVQYSDREPQKDFMNTSIQYEDQEGRFCDFGLQIDDQTRPKENINQFVQTIITGDDSSNSRPPKKPYMLDQQVQASIPIIKDEVQVQTQTNIVQVISLETNTQILSYVNRSAQFPEEQIKAVEDTAIENEFIHLYDKRRNIVDSEYYSVDKFEEKGTKYKWVGRANLGQNLQTLKSRVFMECLVFSVYNFFGIKTPEKRLSYQNCGNVVGDKAKEACYHVLTPENPQLHYPFHFQECNFQKQMFPLSQGLTFKKSKQVVKLNNYGGFLAIAYFLNDIQIFHPTHVNLGFVVSNQQVKEIHKLSAQNYELHPSQPHPPMTITVSPHGQNRISYDRLSSQIEFEFISMLSRIVSQQSSEELSRYIRQIFIHLSPSYPQYKNTLLSLRTNQIDTQLVEDFIKSLESKIIKIKQDFQAQIYSYNKYRSLKPTIKYSSIASTLIVRKIKYENRIVSYNQVLKHIIKKDTVVLVTGESGMGKTTLLKQLVSKLQQTQTINLINVNEIGNQQKKIRSQLQQSVKNVIVIDNAERYHFQIVQLINQSWNNQEISFCLLSSNQNQLKKLSDQLKHCKIVHLQLLPLSNEEAEGLMMKCINSPTITTKKTFVEDFLSKKKYNPIFTNPFYLFLFCKVISHVKLQQLTLTDQFVSKYSILKQAVALIDEEQKKQMGEMGFKLRQTTLILRKIALEYFQYGQSLNESIVTQIKDFESDDIIRNQLAYFPIEIDSIFTEKFLFTHRQYFYYYLVEAYSYFLQKGYRNLQMSKFLADPHLVSMIGQKYKLERSHQRLLQVVYNTRKFKNTYQQSSNVVTLLVKIGHIFTNLNLDQVIIPDADLSNGIFYNCTFRAARMDRVQFYKTQMVHCLMDNAEMANINLLMKKYELQFLTLTTSISPDMKYLALGCGNYLIILNTETGKEFKKIQAHLDIIRTVKYSKDGMSLITIGDDKTVRIWDTHSYRCVVFKLPQKGPIYYSNETQTIAIVTKNALKIWNIKSMAGDINCEGHTQLITCVDFSKDGKFFLTGSRDTSLRLWDLAGNQKSVFNGHSSQIVVGRISVSNRFVFSSSKDRDLVIWECSSKSQIKSKKFEQEVSLICLDIKQIYLIIALYNQSPLIVLNYVTLEVVNVLNGHTARILSITFDDRFSHLVSLAKDKCVIIWDFNSIMNIQKSQKKLLINNGPVLALAYSKGEKKYATSYENGEINMWDAYTNQLIDQFFSHNGPVRCLGFDKNNRLYSGGSDGCIRIWQLSKKREAKEMKVHAEQVIKLRISSKSKFIASSSNANQIVVHDISGVNILMSTRAEGRIYAIDFSKDDKLMAIGGSQKFVVIYQLDSDRNSTTRLEQLGEHSEAIKCVAFHSENLLISCLKNGHISIWNHPKGILLKKIQNPSPITSLLPLLDKFICMASEDGKVRIINIDEGKQIKVFRYSESANSIDTDALSTLLYTATTSGNILVWNLNSLFPPLPKIHFDRLAFDADCSECYSVESGTSLLRRDLLNYREQVIVLNVESEIEGVSFVKEKVVVLLKNGKLWQLGKGQFHFPSQNEYQGDLYYMRDTKELNLYRTQFKKAKGIKNPVQMFLEARK